MPIVRDGGDALGGLTFVLLLDVCVAQAHQSHLEAENPHFAVSSAGDGERHIKRREINSSHLRCCVQVMLLDTPIGGVLPKCGGISRAQRYSKGRRDNVKLNLSPS